ncbi:MAG: glycosyltransferase family 2 protein [Hyphomicrobiaceae bacterium]|nr:MAG: glycosyltransferase family 2 protein [Hyphomicrobiaceae bacterium]
MGEVFGGKTEAVLSICIPTYNFGAFIGETLESIACQDLSGAEIVILDSASTDDTPAVVAGFTSRLPNLRYIRADRKNGIDRDMARVVEEARGEYVWLFSADDIMRPGAVAAVARELSPDIDVVLCSHTICDREMRFLFDYPVLRAPSGAVFDLGSAGSRHDYFARAANTEAFFSFMSGVIVKRETWRSVPLNEMFVGSCWAHVARLFEVIVRYGLRVRYIGGPLLDKRGDNDSFAAASTAERWCLSIAGYSDIVAASFGAHSIEALHVRRVLRVEFPLMSFVSLRYISVRLGVPQETALVDDLCLRLHGPARGNWRWLIYRAFALIPADFLKGLGRMLDATGTKGILRWLMQRLT